MLQWGRGFAATEGDPSHGRSSVGELLQWGRGFAATEGRQLGKDCGRLAGFNGAVASQPRKGRAGAQGHCPLCRFNGAVASQPRKGPHDKVGNIGHRASMGPWLRSHGRQVKGKQCASLKCFNGAVASQPRKAVFLIRSASYKQASMGPWLRSHGRVVLDPFTGSGSTGLQWGRGFAATEGKRHRIDGATDAALQWGRGFAATEGRSPRPGSGCSSALQWGRGFAATEGRRQADEADCQAELQWGRGFAATEGFRVRAIIHPLSGASMGPWLRSHGRPEASQGAEPHRSRFNGAVASQPRKGIL